MNTLRILALTTLVAIVQSVCWARAFDDGIKAYGAGQWDGAIGLLKKAVGEETGERQTMARLWLGYAYVAKATHSDNADVRSKYAKLAAGELEDILRYLNDRPNLLAATAAHGLARTILAELEARGPEQLRLIEKAAATWNAVLELQKSGDFADRARTCLPQLWLLQTAYFVSIEDYTGADGALKKIETMPPPLPARTLGYAWTWRGKMAEAKADKLPDGSEKDEQERAAVAAYKKAVEHLLNARSESQKAKDKPQESDDCLWLGRAYRGLWERTGDEKDKREHANLAIKAYEDAIALKLDWQAEDRAIDELGHLRLDLGKWLCQRGDNRDAAKTLEQAERGGADVNRLAQLYHALCLARIAAKASGEEQGELAARALRKLRAGPYGDALEQASQMPIPQAPSAEGLSEQENNAQLAAYMLADALTACDQKKWATAEAELERLTEWLQPLADPQWLATAHYCFAGLLMRRLDDPAATARANDLDTAAEHYKEAEKLDASAWGEAAREGLREVAEWPEKKLKQARDLFAQEDYQKCHDVLCTLFDNHVIDIIGKQLESEACYMRGFSLEKLAQAPGEVDRENLLDGAISAYERVDASAREWKPKANAALSGLYLQRGLALLAVSDYDKAKEQFDSSRRTISSAEAEYLVGACNEYLAATGSNNPKSHMDGAGAVYTNLLLKGKGEWAQRAEERLAAIEKVQSNRVLLAICTDVADKSFANFNNAFGLSRLQQWSPSPAWQNADGGEITAECLSPGFFPEIMFKDITFKVLRPKNGDALGEVNVEEASRLANEGNYRWLVCLEVISARLWVPVKLWEVASGKSAGDFALKVSPAVVTARDANAQPDKPGLFYRAVGDMVAQDVLAFIQAKAMAELDLSLPLLHQWYNATDPVIAFAPIAVSQSLSDALPASWVADLRHLTANWLLRTVRAKGKLRGVDPEALCHQVDATGNVLSDADAIEAARQLGANLLMVGSVEGVDVKVAALGSEQVGYVAQVQLQLRLLRVADGSEVKRFTAKGDAWSVAPHGYSTDDMQRRTDLQYRTLMGAGLIAVADQAEAIALAAKP